MDMDMSSSDMTDMTSMTAAMSFFTATNTSLYSTMWTPATSSAYAGTCIFLIFLAIVFRSLFIFKALLEARWHDQAVNRRYIVVAGKAGESGRISTDPDAKSAVLSVNGIEESVHVVQSHASKVQPWRFSVDLPRAALVTVTSGVGWLLMLAIMTMNVGYFCSVLAGTFIGEATIGRYSTVAPEH